jgi:N6-adenosine-specific RNA methylase IME4
VDDVGETHDPQGTTNQEIITDQHAGAPQGAEHDKLISGKAAANSVAPLKPITPTIYAHDLAENDLSPILDNIVKQETDFLEVWTYTNLEQETLDSEPPSSQPSRHSDPAGNYFHWLEPWDGCFNNATDKSLYMRITQPIHTPSEELESVKLISSTGEFHNYKRPFRMRPLSFTIPPMSSFYLGDCEQPGPVQIRNMLRSYAQDYHTKRFFDFILLDPPWPNSSAKRKGSYSAFQMLGQIDKMFQSMDLDRYIAPSGLVGVWVTNRPKVRELVLGFGGLFERLNVSLVEEWVWLKTTVNGEPVTDLDGLWRKPYEVLLLGRAPASRLETAQTAVEVKRRVIVGVPDLHSRKPCLKTLIESMLPQKYQALEIFARYLVAEWWSWGNEVLKFNWDGYWTEDEKVPSGPD